MHTPDGDISEFTLSSDLEDGSVVLAFFPGAYTYAWVADDPSVEPDYDEIETAAAEAA